MWSKDHITVLIEAYKKEHLLYTVKHPNYHNKYLRNEALKRIFNEVRRVRPNLDEKECTNKIYSLRNTFNAENKKRKESIKSGCGTDDIYIPNLWYFEMLTFLEEHFVPRDSISTKIGSRSSGENVNSAINEVNEGTDFDVALENHTIRKEQNASKNNANFNEEEHVYSNNETSIETSEVVSRSSGDSNNLNLSRNLTSSYNCTSGVCSKRKRTLTTDDDPLEKIIETLNKPVTVSRTEKDKDSTEICMEFVGSLIRKINDETEQEKLMADIIHLVMMKRPLQN